MKKSLSSGCRVDKQGMDWFTYRVKGVVVREEVAGGALVGGNDRRGVKVLEPVDDDKYSKWSWYRWL